MIRLMQIMAGSENGGAENFFVRLSLALADIGISQKIITRPNSYRVPKLRSSKLSVIEAKFGNFFDYNTDKIIRKEFKNFMPDAVISWMNRGTFHTTRSLKSENFIHVARLGGYYNLKYYKNCDYLIANTKGIYNWLEDSNINNISIHYIPNFVEESYGFIGQRSNKKVDIKKVNIFSAGRLHENKGFDILIRSIVNMKNIYLSIAGDGPLKNYLVNLSKKLGISDRVSFLGWRNDLSNIFKESDIFVCPSRHEPLGNVILEAWANKIPVIAAGSQGPKELITNNFNGILFPVDNVSLLSKSIFDLASDRKKIEKLIDNGYLSYKKNFTKEVVTKNYFNFLQLITK